MISNIVTKGVIHKTISPMWYIGSEYGDSWSELSGSQYNGAGNSFFLYENIEIAQIKAVLRFSGSSVSPGLRISCSVFEAETGSVYSPKKLVATSYKTYESEQISNNSGSTDVIFPFLSGITLKAGIRYVFLITTQINNQDSSILQIFTQSTNPFDDDNFIQRQTDWTGYESTTSHDCYFVVYSYRLWTSPTTTISAKAKIKKNINKNISAKARIRLNTDPGRKGKLFYGIKFPDHGVDITDVPSFTGYTDFPQIDSRQKIAKFKLFDELENLNRYKLSGGSLQQNTRTDRYIWSILDEVYKDHFQVIASCNSDETWTGRTLDQTNHRGGDGCTKVISTSGAEQKAYRSITANLSAYDDETPLYVFIYVENKFDLSNVEIRLHTSANQSWFSYIVKNLVTGWNEVVIYKKDFVSSYDATFSAGYFKIGTSSIEGAHVIPSLVPDWSSITRVEFIVDATGSNTTFCLFDEFRIVDRIKYPRRYIDVGLHMIPVAWFDGNTALYEIKEACEAEGARFYCDEEGNIRFENRQYYNNHSEWKKSRWQFDYDNMFDFFYNTKESEIINKVVVKVNPRKVQTTQDIWQSIAVYKIEAGATKQVWAQFNDPCPTTVSGIIAPVATTDYTANVQEDGLGTDKTAQVSISITRFARSAILDITNGDAGAVYITSLKLRGTPAKEGDAVIVTSEDTNSIGRYGVKPSGGYSVEKKYLADETYAKQIADQLIGWYKNPLTKVKLKNRSIIHLQLGDMITVYDKITNTSNIMRIIGIKNQFSSAGLNQEIDARQIAPFEQLSYFTIGTSAIESVDVISF